MLKLLGALLVLAAAIGLGTWQAARRQHRHTLLQDIGAALAALQREISCRALPWPQACRVAAEYAGIARELLLDAAVGCAEMGAGEAWQQAVQAYLPHLPQEAGTVLRELGAALGRSDMAEQLAALSAARQQLQQLREEERLQLQQNRRICLHLGWSVGLMLVLFFW